MMGFNHLEIFQAAVPTVSRHKRRFQAPRQHFSQHLLKRIVFRLVFRFIANAAVDGLMVTVRISVTQRDQVNPLDHPMMFPRSKMTHEGDQMAIRFVEYAVIDTDGTPRQIQFGSDFIE